MSEAIIVIVVVIVLTVIMVSALVAWAVSSEPKPEPLLSTVSGLAGVMEPCVSRPCRPGLVCDGSTFTCRFGEGAICDEYAECASGLFCSGVCVRGPTGYLNNYCPCVDGYQCMHESGTATTICKSLSSTCGKAEDCVSLICGTDGFCRPGFPNAYPCTRDGQCESFNCSQGFCQAINETSGNLGSACASNCVPWSGANCHSDVGLSCQCNSGVGQPGTCVIASQGIQSVCGTNLFCDDIFVCSANTGTSPVCTGSNCSCRFPYPDPNLQNSLCIPGMVALGNICLNAEEIGCNSDDQCGPGLNCTGFPTLTYYQLPGLNFATASSISILPAAKIPSSIFTGSMAPKKMFAGKDSVIYLVDDNYGLLSYDSSSLQWTQVLPKVSSYGILIDAAMKRFSAVGCFCVFQQGNYTVLYGALTFTDLSPFNPQGGPGPSGTQYLSTGSAITINYLAVANDYQNGFAIALTTTAGVVLTKGNTDIYYQQAIVVGGPANGQMIIGTTGPVRFYYDNRGNSKDNLAYVAQQYIGGNGNPRPIQFSGPAAGISLPFDVYGTWYYQVTDFDIYSPAGVPTDTFANMNVNVLAQSATLSGNQPGPFIVALYNAGLLSFMPYQLSSASKVGISSSRYYQFSVASCQR